MAQFEPAFEQMMQDEGVCNKDPQECWSVRCQLGKQRKNTPPQRPWVGLTDEDEIDWDGGDLKSLIAAVEAKLKEKNT